MKKVTILGDIMVEPPFMQQVAKNGTWDFYPSFQPLKSILAASDYVIGNLETPLAGEESGYTTRIVSFNSPDTLVQALLDIGVNAVSTANNHCLDRGYDGLVKTLETLDRFGLPHTGTYPENFDGERIHYFTVGDTKFALIAYTVSTNYRIHKNGLTENQLSCLNMLHTLSGEPAVYRPLPQVWFDTLHYVEGLMGRKLEWEESTKLKRIMQMPKASIDVSISEEVLSKTFRNVEKDYHEARENADIVLFYPHSGGQFNEEPGDYTKYVVKKSAELGFDAIFSSHSHTSQKAEFVEGKPCFYSLGNVSMSPGTFYSVPECLPEYGLAAHLYVEEKKIQKVTFSIFKMVEENGEALRVVPVDDLYQELSGEKREKLLTDVASVYHRVSGQALAEGPLCREYDLPVNG